ncbi:MAG: zf-HC2 domain-containing protein [Elusimicrobia bacterium]|nr:zf-HC2 domain-containing protein [Elusimicrobiota bacterium]
MNEKISELLSAYLDGALSAAERADVEAQLARSEEMRLELEALRAVSSAVKGLPRAKLPSGFMARLQARRASEQRSWTFLSPAYRPAAFALSTAVVALMVWDRAREPQEPTAIEVGWQGDKVPLKTAAEAPPSQFDFSRSLSAMKDQATAPIASNIAGASSEPAAADRAEKETSMPRGKAPGKPMEFAEEQAGGTGPDSFLARSEEERSAINERLYVELEKEKKRMGIAQILEKSDERSPASAQDVMVLEATPAAPRVDEGGVLRKRGASALRGASSARQAASAKVVVLNDLEALKTAWDAANLPGDPPAVDFPRQMAVFLACPPGCGIVSVRSSAEAVIVRYKNSGFDYPAARVRAVPSSSKPTVLKLVP